MINMFDKKKILSLEYTLRSFILFITYDKTWTLKRRQISWTLKLKLRTN
jgi:hypothetical protein